MAAEPVFSLQYKRVTELIDAFAEQPSTWLASNTAVQGLLLRCSAVPGFPGGKGVTTEAEVCKFLAVSPFKKRPFGRIGCREPQLVQFL